MTKSMRITVPVVGDCAITRITPESHDMGLSETSDALLYGFNGDATSKGQFLNAAYQLADKDGAISHGKKILYLVDMEYTAPASFNDKILYGQLPLTMLDKTPFLLCRRLKNDCASLLGDMWFEWAKTTYGQKKALNADVDWTDEMSFMPAFPSLAENLFTYFPKLRSAVIPMQIKTGKASNLICWVGVSPKDKASQWVSHAEVRMQPGIRVDLTFGRAVGD